MSIGWMSLIVVSPLIWPTSGSNLFISKLISLDVKTIETHVLHLLSLITSTFQILPVQKFKVISNTGCFKNKSYNFDSVKKLQRLGLNPTISIGCSNYMKKYSL